MNWCAYRMHSFQREAPADRFGVHQFSLLICSGLVYSYTAEGCARTFLSANNLNVTEHSSYDVYACKHIRSIYMHVTDIYASYDIYICM
jgi:hypothetical protein